MGLPVKILFGLKINESWIFEKFSLIYETRTLLSNGVLVFVKFGHLYDICKSRIREVSNSKNIC